MKPKQPKVRHNLERYPMFGFINSDYICQFLFLFLFSFVLLFFWSISILALSIRLLALMGEPVAGNANSEMFYLYHGQFTTVALIIDLYPLLFSSFLTPGYAYLLYLYTFH